MTFELRLYDPDGGFDADGVPLEVSRVVSVDLPAPSSPNPMDAWPRERQAQVLADILDALAYANGAQP